jgi:hypothetical protein
MSKDEGDAIELEAEFGIMQQSRGLDYVQNNWIEEAIGSCKGSPDRAPIWTNPRIRSIIVRLETVELKGVAPRCAILSSASHSGQQDRGKVNGYNKPITNVLHLILIQIRDLVQQRTLNGHVSPSAPFLPVCQNRRMAPLKCHETGNRASKSQRQDFVRHRSTPLLPPQIFL